MKRIYTTANGRQLNLDSLIAQNENTIAVGNMKVNARGDQLGPGGKIKTPKDEVMKEHYKLHTPMASEAVAPRQNKKAQKDLIEDWIEPVVDQSTDSALDNESESKPKLRGSLADSIAKTTIQTQVPKKTGPTRI